MNDIMPIELDQDYITVDFPKAEPLEHKRGWQCAKCGAKLEPASGGVACAEWECPLKQLWYR